MPEPVLTLPPYAAHGGPDGAHVRFDFSVNSNPFGPPAELLGQLGAVEVSSYPDPSYGEARTAAARFHSVPLENIVLGGAAELIYRLSACYLQPGRGVLVAAPSFGEYVRAAQLYGARIAMCNVYAKGAEPDVAALVYAVQNIRPTLVWLCQPNNPTGHAWGKESLAEVADTCQKHDALLVIDAAYLELSAATREIPEAAVTLFPLTKTFGIAGLRAGYAAAPPEIAETLRRAAPPWPVSTPAAAAVHWCRAEGQAFVEKTVPELLELRQMFQTGVQNLGFETWASAASFFLVAVGDAAGFTARAKAAGFRVRDASSFGLRACVRLAAQRREDNSALLEWLAL